MRLSTAKDKLLKHITKEENYTDLLSARIAGYIKTDHYLVVTALLELQESKMITLIEIADGKMPSYAVQRICAPAYYFQKNKRFRVIAIQDFVKDFIKSYLALVVFIVTIAINIYQISLSRKEKAEWKDQKQQLNHILDSLQNSKRLENSRKTRNDKDSLEILIPKDSN